MWQTINNKKAILTYTFLPTDFKESNTYQVPSVTKITKGSEKAEHM